MKETADHMRGITDELRLLQRSLQESLLDGSCMSSDQSVMVEAVDEFKSVIDQMRQFLWFYLNALSNGEQLIELLPLSPFLSHQIRQDTWVDRPGPRAHHQAFERREAHGRINTPTAIYGSKRAAIPQVAGHQPK